MAPWLAVLLGCAGSAVLARWMWLLRGRTAATRSWAKGTERNVTNVMCAIPSVGLALVGVALTGLARQGSGPAWTLSAVCLVLFVVLSAWGGLQIPVPLWALPGWARDEVRRRRARERQPGRR